MIAGDSLRVMNFDVINLYITLQCVDDGGAKLTLEGRVDIRLDLPLGKTEQSTAWFGYLIGR